MSVIINQIGEDFVLIQNSFNDILKVKDELGFKEISKIIPIRNEILYIILKRLSRVIEEQNKQIKLGHSIRELKEYQEEARLDCIKVQMVIISDDFFINFNEFKELLECENLFFTREKEWKKCKMLLKRIVKISTK